MDGSGSTTPSLPPPESSETLNQKPPEPPQAAPPSVQKEVHEEDVAPMESDDQDNRNESVPQSKMPRPAHSKTPEPNRVIKIGHQTNGHMNGHNHAAAAAIAHAPHLVPNRSDSPGSPIMASFDWEDLETRFEKAMDDAREKEQGLMDEFGKLIKYFNVWASSASAHDNERAAKRCGIFNVRLIRWPMADIL